MPERKASIRPFVTVLAVAVAMQCLRALLPVAYAYYGDAGIARTALAIVLVFGAPALVALVTPRLDVRVVVVGAVAFLATMRLALQLVGSVGMGLAGLAAAAGLVAITVVARPEPDGPNPTIAIVAGLALDTAVRAAWGTWDLSWQGGAGPMLVTVVLVVALVGVAVYAASSMKPTGGTARLWLALGPYLALQVLMFQSLAMVASAGGVSLATATAVVLVGDGLAVGAADLTLRRHASPALLGAATVALAGVAFAVTRATGVAAITLIAVGQVLATSLLARACADAPATRPRPAAVAAGILGGMLALGLTLLLYQLHYERHLPVSNRWLPAIAALVLGAAAFGANPATVERGAVPRRTRAVVGAAVALAVVLVGGLALGEPDLASRNPRPQDLRVMTYNVDDTVTRGGQLDPEAMARTIERIDPDVLVIEEAGRGWLLSSTLDLGEWAKRRLGLPYRWAPAADGQMGDLMFSRVPIRHARVVHLPQGTGRFPRSALIAKVGPVAGKVWTVIGTHLQDGSTPDRHQTRVDEMDVMLAAWDGAPRTIIAGDLNADPGSRELRHLLAAGFSTTQPSTACTLKTSNDNCVDWILVTDDLVQGRPTVLPVDSFDHRPLSATVRPR